MDYAWLTELNEHGVGADPAFGGNRGLGDLCATGLASRAPSGHSVRMTRTVAPSPATPRNSCSAHALRP